MADAATLEPGPRARREAMVNKSVHRAITPMPGRETHIEPKRVEGEPQAPDAQLSCVLHQDAENRRVQVQVQVPVHMVQRETRLGEPLELLMNFRAQLITQCPTKEIAQAHACWVCIKLQVRVHQLGNPLLRQSRVAANKCEVQSNAESGIFTGQLYGLREGPFVGHEAGGSKNALAM